MVLTGSYVWLRLGNDAGGSTSDVHVRVRGVRCVWQCRTCRFLCIVVPCKPTWATPGYKRGSNTPIVDK